MMITFCSHCGSENPYKIKAPEICSTCKQSISGNLKTETAAVTPAKRKDKPKPEYKSRFKSRRVRDEEDEETKEGTDGEEVDLDAIYNYKAAVQVSVDKNTYKFKDVIGTGSIGIDRGSGNDTNIDKVLKDIAQTSQRNSIDLD